MHICYIHIVYVKTLNVKMRFFQQRYDHTRNKYDKFTAWGGNNTSCKSDQSGITLQNKQSHLSRISP